MVNIKDALNKARGKRQAAPRGRAIVEVQSVDTASNTFTGKILVGVGAGEEIRIRLNNDVDQRQLSAEGLMKGRTKVDLPKDGMPGGTVQVEGLTRKDKNDFYDVRWAKTFQPKPHSDGQTAHLGSTFRLNVIQNRDNGERWASVAIADVENETFARDAESMKAAMIKAFDDRGGVTLATVGDDGEPIEVSYYTRNRKTEDGYVRESGAERFEEFEKNLGQSLEEVFGEVLKSNGISVVPTQGIRVGNETWAAVEEKLEERGRGGPVDPSMFMLTPLAGRFAGAFNRLETEADKKAVIDAFKAQANEDAKEKYQAKGFAGVEDRDIKAFLDAQGVTLTVTPDAGQQGRPAMGYVSGGFLTLPYDRDNPETSDVMITKTFATTAAAPFLPVKAFEAIRARYYEELPEALKEIAANILSGDKAAVKEAPAAATEAPAAAETPKAVEETAANAGDDLEIEDIDDMLDDIGDEIDPR